MCKRETVILDTDFMNYMIRAKDIKDNTYIFNKIDDSCNTRTAFL